MFFKKRFEISIHWFRTVGKKIRLCLSEGQNLVGK